MKSRMKSRTLSLNTAFISSPAVAGIIASRGAAVIATYIAVLTIVRRNGWHACWNDSTRAEAAALTGLNAAHLDADIEAIVAAGFFDSALFAARRVLSSRRLQSAYRRRRDAEAIPEELSLARPEKVRSKRHARQMEIPLPENRRQRRERLQAEKRLRRKQSRNTGNARRHVREDTAP